MPNSYPLPSKGYYVAVTPDGDLKPVHNLRTAKLVALWGTYGKDGMEHCFGTCPEHQLRWKRLLDCDTEHLLAILATQWQLHSTCYPKVIESILLDRGVCYWTR